MTRPRLSLAPHHAKPAVPYALIKQAVRLFVHFIVRLARFLPAALDKLHLEWALREIDPMHPDVPHIVRRLNELERAM